MSSRLESLSPEIFSHILSYLIGDETPIFHLEILRVNKGIHAVAKSYLDGNDWIKFQFNYPETQHTAAELAIRTYTVTNASIAKLPTVLAVDVRFPGVEPPVGTGSEHSQIKKRTVPSTKRLYLSTMILAADAPELLRCIRLQDLTDCCRIDPRRPSATSIGLRTAHRAPVHGIA